MIYIASDHAGFEHKEALREYFAQNGIKAEDMGAFVYTEGDDYPEIMAKVGLKVCEDPTKNKGIIFGGSGQGEAIMCNRFPEVRAVVYYGGPLDIVRLSREHNDANVLSIGARFLSKEEMINAAELWLKTPFSGDERHKRRIEQIDSMQ